MIMKTFLVLIVVICYRGSVTGYGYPRIQRYKDPIVERVVDDNGCGEQKGCFRDPESCKLEDCFTLLTWQRHTDFMKFEISHNIDRDDYGQNVWTSVGLSNDQNMALTSVVDCIHNEDKIRVQASYNPGYWNSVLKDPMLGIREESISGTYIDGRISCSYERAIEVDDTLQDSEKIFPLTNNDTYYVIIAFGNLKDDGTKDKHKITPLITSEKINFTQNNVIGGTYEPVLLKLHGCFMIAAWIMFAGIGIITARFCKDIGLERMCLGNKYWFMIHRLCMTLVFGFAVAGFVCIFIEVDGFSDTSGWSPGITQAHPYVGIVAVSLATINPILALFRPHPGKGWRPAFNWIHRTVGTLAFLCALFNVLTGLEIPSASSFTSDWMFILLASYVALHFIAEMSFFLLNKTGKRSGSIGSHDFSMSSNGKTAMEIEYTSHANHNILVFSLVLYSAFAFAAGGAVIIHIATS